MNSSGKRRGAALVAGIALTLSGMAISPAAADDVGENENVAFDFYSQTVDASTRFDGSNNSVSLLSGVSDGLAGAAEVRYEFFSGGTWTEISEIAINNGVAYTEWTPPGGAVGNGITQVRASVLDAAENVIAGPIARPISGNSPTGMQDNNAIELDGALRSRVGMGPDNEVVISGTTTAIELDTHVQNVGPDGTGAEVSPLGANWTPPNGQGVSTFKVAVPVDTSNNPSGGDDEIVIRGRTSDPGLAGNSDDVNVYTMYTQTVTGVTMAPDPDFPASVQLGGANDESRYNITVTDQEGQPIQGLNVCEVANTNPNAPCNGLGNGAPNNTETNVNGVATLSLFESTIDNLLDRDGQTTLGGDPNNAQSTYYIVDVNQDGNYDDGIDWRFELVQTGIVPVATTVDITSDRGDVLDDDETTTLRATVKDQNGQPIAGKSTVISGMLECFDTAGNVEFSTPFGPTASPTDANGQIVLSGVGNFGGPCEDGEYALTLDAFANNNGTPVPDEGDAIAETKVLDFNVTEVVWDNGTVAQALNGTTTTQTATLQQVDGDALGADRVIAISYAPTGNSRVAATQTAPTQKVNDTTATSETNAQGKFSVSIEDPAVPNGQELDNDLTAQAPGLESGGADQTDGTLEIDFLRSVTPASVVIYNATTGTSTADGLDPVFSTSTDPMPGGLAEGSVVVRNSDNVVLTDIDVNVTIDEGHFVDASDAFDPAPAIGGLFGEWKSVGQSTTVRTEDDGRGDFLVNIERNEGFDDDGLVDDNLHATAGAASDEHDFTWTTRTVPLNTGSFEVVLSSNQESSVLPKARAGNTELDAIPGNGSGQIVDYDVVTTDQFGNRTSQAITVADNGNPLAGFVTTGSSEFDLSQPAISAFASAATDQTLEVELDGSISVKFVDNPADSSFDPSAFPPSYIAVALDQQQVDTDAINWYEPDYAASTYTLGQLGPETVPVGSLVTEKLKAVDQEGQPLENMVVDFLRGGPSNDDDDTCNEDLLANCQVTDARGEAFYDFVGGSQGTANVSAVLYNDQGVRVATVGPDTVLFKGGGGQVPINVKLTGKSSGKKDILTVNAPSIAVGAKVMLQKKVGKKWVQVGKTKKLDGSGDRQFGVKDKNGKKVTKYRAKVMANKAVFGDTTPVLRLK